MAPASGGGEPRRERDRGDDRTGQALGQGTESEAHRCREKIDPLELVFLAIEHQRKAQNCAKCEADHGGLRSTVGGDGACAELIARDAAIAATGSGEEEIGVDLKRPGPL